ncbi:regulator of protease activity HflC (stomatin/prohibitin superfamily) [Acidovorax delafieldii]|uniref:Regulator of protease activity HflC (Stomatin/prohibitin superfamily) n=1 Tax=Acidovorax delafieldii TaxID=47920 RepID=A0AAJ2CAV3_ACIDE|nr:prohibitin family protein [Acidovorax delafieldii]MDR6768671.1 regulator of protease activity HflC (stomatin/prohibitin superfamily) [Acidovorax delafieldii]MDR6837387.1 regulator of protease activity HflC (stomatin/prohibitin superfamily) [Acidovorax delafieldii]MDR7366877.1 regulator of protease activity HflC (stomatin/prohibitin superfamily) [Acidovorax delafieldii]
MKFQFPEITSRHIKLGAFALLAFILSVYMWPLRTVPTGHRGVITIGGAIKGIEQEGFTLVWPWQNLSVFNIRAESAEINNADGATSDQQPVKTSLVVRYSVMPDKVAHVFEQFSRDGNLDSYIQTASMDSFKAVTARYTAPELIAKRPQVASDIVAQIRQKSTMYGAQIISVDMTNFAFNPAYMAAINEKVTQEQLRQAAENKVLTVSAQQKEKIAIAEAEATARKAEADGRAYATTKRAEAEANALRIQNAALRESKDVLELRRIEVELAKAGKWDGKLPVNMYSSGPLPFLNLSDKPAK